MKQKETFLCIDLKSFYASVECVERGLDPFTTNLVVADPDRSVSTICLAITPAMKKLGIRNRCRIHEIPDHIEYIVAKPRMQLYMEYSARIYGIYLNYVAKEDIHVYSVDECFMDVTRYLRLKHHKYVVQSAICDKKVEIERAKLVEQAKNIAKPREKKSCLSEIQLYNSMVLGIQNYYQLATCISIDCRELHRRVMTVLTNRLNTETGSMLKHEGGTITQAEKERFGQSKMIRYVSGIDQMIYPIAFIKNKIPMAKRSIVCSYTKEGRAPIHTELNLNQYVLKGLREKISVGHSTEYHDSKISLFSAQKGKCAISGEEFADAEHVAVWLKVPRALGGFERYKNMVLIHKKYLILLQELPQAVIKDLIKTLNITKKMLVKINSLREQANLSAII
ncbi:MAG: hypothetical protein ACLU79_09670 [Clostridium sp.]